MSLQVQVEPLKETKSKIAQQKTSFHAGEEANEEERRLNLRNDIVSVKRNEKKNGMVKWEKVVGEKGGDDIPFLFFFPFFGGVFETTKPEKAVASKTGFFEGSLISATLCFTDVNQSGSCSRVYKN